LERSQNSLQNPVVKTILNDWQVSGIVSMISGSPLGIGYSRLPALTSRVRRAKAPAGCCRRSCAAQKRETFARNFNTDAFKAPAKERSQRR